MSPGAWLRALHGAPAQTLDVGIVFAQDPANIDRLLKYLESVDAIYRIQPQRKLRPAKSHLEGRGHLNLLTRKGPVDLLPTIGQNLDYSDWLPHSTEMDIGGSFTVRVLNLETIISIKEQLRSEKDLAALPILRRTFKESPG